MNLFSKNRQKVFFGGIILDFIIQFKLDVKMFLDKMKILRTIFVFTLFLFSLNSFAGIDTFVWYVNDVPAVKDTLNKTLYISIQADTASVCRVQTRMVCSEPEKLNEILWDETPINLTDDFEVSDWKSIHSLSLIKNQDLEEKWSVVFTTNAIVELQLDHTDNLSKYSPALGHIKIADAFCRTDSMPFFSTSIKAYYRGATARTFPKKSFAICLLGANGEECDYNLMGIRLDDKWILDAMAVDPSRMRNRLCFDLWNGIEEKSNPKMIRNGTQGCFVEVILNGAYHGMYCLTDKVNRKLLGVKKNKNSGDSPLRGRLYKCQSADTPNHFLVMPDEEYPLDEMKWGDWELKYPDENVYNDTYKPLIDLIDFTTKVKVDTQYVDHHIYEYFYEDNVTSFPVFGLAVLLLDNMMHNSYISFYNTDEDSRAWITPWDMDGSFGRDGLGKECHWQAKSRWVFQKTEPFYTLFKNPVSNLSQAMAEKWNKLKTSVLSVENVFKAIDDYAGLFQKSGAWERERNRWSKEMTVLDDTPWSEAEYMKNWYSWNFDHLEEMFAQITGIEELSMDQNEQIPQNVYTLDGRKVNLDLQSPLCPKGIYIVNGRKIVK